MKNNTISILATALLLAVLYAPATVAQTTYQSWGDPDQPGTQNGSTTAADERLKSLIDQLNTLLTQGENDRAADPVFLRDLRDLVRSYEGPSASLVLHDDFSDGNFNANPVWIVGTGRYFIEKDWGIRNALETAQTNTSSGGADPGVELLATILGKALGGNTTTSSSAATAQVQPNSIFSDTAITNAFAIELSLSSWVNKGKLMVGPYQGSNRNTGYRLVYNVGGSIDLLAKSASGVRTIDTARGPFNLEDKKVHDLVWSRDSDGNMQVTLDGTSLFQLRDVSFRDPFNGFGMATSGGDFIVKSVDVYSVQ